MENSFLKEGATINYGRNMDDPLATKSQIAFAEYQFYSYLAHEEYH